jgi:hypothetical protein
MPCPSDADILEAINVAWLRKLREVNEMSADRLTATQEAIARDGFKLGFAEGFKWALKVRPDAMPQ